MRFLLIIATIAIIFGAAGLFLRPKDQLRALQPYIVGESTQIVETGAGPLRVRVIDLRKVSPLETKDILLKSFPKSSAYSWSGTAHFFDISCGMVHTVSIMPEPLGIDEKPNTIGASTEVTEYLLLDKKTDLWERFVMRRKTVRP